MTDKKPRRAFDTAFKLQVVKMIQEQRLSIGQVCKDMNLVDSAAPLADAVRADAAGLK